MIRDLVVEARPWQYTKNLILFAGLVFARHLLDARYLTRSVVAFVAFCLLSSAIYVMNDLVDLDRDRVHPRKKNRPLASGRLSRGAGILLLAFFLLAGSALVLWLGKEFLIAAALFFALNTAYTFFLKHLVVLDVMAIALSFEVRAIAGVEAFVKFHSTGLVYSIPFVVYGVFRYLYLIYEKKSGGSPSEVLLTDFPLLLTILLWVSAVFWAVYYGTRAAS
jgi:4-hydroxybenzoate polyprenyltransferase